MFVAAKAVDLDGDGMGEVGTLGELTGFDPLRGHPEHARLDPALTAPSLRPTGAHGTARRAGYHLRLYLPGRDGTWVRIDEDPGKRDVNAAESRWCLFAWPAHHGPGTTRTLRIDFSGRVTATEARIDPTVLPRLNVSDWVEVR